MLGLTSQMSSASQYLVKVEWSPFFPGTPYAADPQMDRGVKVVRMTGEK